MVGGCGEWVCGGGAGWERGVEEALGLEHVVVDCFAEFEGEGEEGGGWLFCDVGLWA